MALNKPIYRDVYRAGIPLLVCALICATGVAVVLSAYRIYAYAGPDRIQDVCWDVFWIILWTGLSEFLALLIGVLVYQKLCKRIVRLQSELSDLTRAVLHDLKTPITHIRNATEEAMNGTKPAAEVMPDILESCESITDILNANAEISRTYSAKPDEFQSTVDFAAIARQCVELYEAIAEDKGVALNASIPDEAIPVAMLKGQVQHLINNLIDNAIKFTPTGGRIDLTLSSSQNKLTLTVSDTGCGIEKDKLPYIFDRFYRADFSRSTPGYGLGLALASAIVKSHRGTINVYSTLNHGTTFTVTLPTSQAC